MLYLAIFPGCIEIVKRQSVPFYGLDSLPVCQIEQYFKNFFFQGRNDMKYNLIIAGTVMFVMFD